MYVRIKQILKHHWFDESATRRALPPDAVKRLGQRVAASEQRHSGQIRIYVEAGLPLNYLLRKLPTRQITRQRALAVFSELRAWDTERNNGVLIYLLLAERSIEIVADRGLNDKVTPPAWQALMSGMRTALLARNYEAGLAEALDQVSTLLVQHFPLQSGQVNLNELPDTPVLR